MAYCGPRHTSTRPEKIGVSTVDALFTIRDTLFFTVATLFAMPAGGVRPPPLIRTNNSSWCPLRPYIETTHWFVCNQTEKS
jgi:hypothetical protein